MEKKSLTSSHTYRLLVFWVGIIATVAYRLLIALNRFGQNWVDIVWYVGTFGFVWYFAHRYSVEKKRDKVITERNLIEKISSGKNLSEEDRLALAMELQSLISSKSRLNYIVIFIASGAALLYDIVLRLFFK